MIRYKRWIYLAVGTLLLIFCGLIYGWSLFKEPFHQVYTQWSLAQISMPFTISMISSCLSGFAAGKLTGVLSPQKKFITAAAMVLVGFAFVSQMDPESGSRGLWTLYLCYGLLSGAGIGVAYNTVIGTVNPWFPDRPGLASGIMMMGYGLGALILGGVATGLIGAVGIFRTFLILGIALFVVLFIGSFIVKLPTAEELRDLQPAAAASGEDAERDEILTGIGPGEMVKRASFWVFLCWCVVINTGGMMIVNSAASIALAFGAPAIVGMVVSIFNGAGRVIMGGIYDKKGANASMAINMAFLLSSGLLLLIGAKTSSTVLILLGLLAMGLTYGSNLPICSTFIQRYYGPKFFSVNFSLGLFNLIPASFIGPMVGSVLVERSGGDYTTSFAVILLCAAAAFLLWGALIRVVKREKASQAQAS